MRKDKQKCLGKGICAAACMAMLLSGCGQEGGGLQDGTDGNVTTEQSTDATEQSTDATEQSTDATGQTVDAGADGADAGSGAAAQTVTIEDLLVACEHIDLEMYERATSFPEGDVTRIAAAMRKAEAGEPVTIGVIGGSITQGSSASSPDKCYASLLKAWWEENFPDSEITFINAGVGGTTSYLGVHRVDEHLLQYEPDFVIVEFSVNDSNNAYFKKTYDNLVRRILKQENMPAVMLLFMTMEDGTSAQVNDALIGFQYELPMLSYQNAVLDEVKAGTFSWDDISPDNIHPNTKGHAIVGELLSVYLTDIYNRLDTIEAEVTPFEKDAVTKEVYMEATILNTEDIEPDAWGSFEAADVNSRFPGNWTTQTGEESLVFTVEAANIGIMYQKTTDGLSGQFDVLIDGEYAMTLNGDFSGGWGNYEETIEVYVSEEKATHTIEIKKKDDSTGDALTILGLMVS